MKKMTIMFAISMAAAGLSFAATPIVVAPVGPNPDRPMAPGEGQLEVFSALRSRSEGNNPAWFQHTDYYLYDQSGNRLKRVDNTVGRYAERPRVIGLPAGEYFIKAEAKDYQWVKVPVIIADGRTTRVHLDDAWQPAGLATKVVSLPDGDEVGWRANRGN